ncbi:MAG: type II secretion system protein [Planctomycetales bacterium]|nr:type II secretion system protein [Planctomycetales bacterium]
MNHNNVKPADARMRYQSENTRTKGFTLLEMLVTLIILASVLAGVINLLSVTRQSNEYSKQNLLRRQAIRRFADDVRRDVADAQRSIIENESLVLTNEVSGSKVSYKIESNSTITRRVESIDDANRSTDTYAVGSDAEIKVSLIQEYNAVQWTIAESVGANQPIDIVAAKRPLQ